MYMAIDGRRLIRQPHTIEIAPDRGRRGGTADRRPIWTPGGDYTVFNCRWGSELSYQDVLRELDRLGMTRGVHGVTFEIYKGQYITLPCWMDKPQYTMMGQSTCGKVITNAFTIPFIQVDTPTALFCMRFWLPGIIAAGDAATWHDAPLAGTPFAVQGWIADLGSGAGQTRIQISNDGTDYLTARGDFINTLPAIHYMQNAVLDTDIEFAAGDTVQIDIDSIPAGGLSKDLHVWLWCRCFRA